MHLVNLVPVCTISSTQNGAESRWSVWPLAWAGRSDAHSQTTAGHRGTVVQPSAKRSNLQPSSCHDYTSSNPSHPSRVLKKLCICRHYVFYVQCLHLTLFLHVSTNIAGSASYPTTLMGRKLQGVISDCSHFRSLGLAFNLPTTSIDANLLRLCKRCVAQHCCCSLCVSGGWITIDVPMLQGAQSTWSLEDSQIFF